MTVLLSLMKSFA